MHDKLVMMLTAPALTATMSGYDELGFTRGMGPTDVTHVHRENTPCSMRHSYVGKEEIPTLSYRNPSTIPAAVWVLRRDNPVRRTTKLSSILTNSSLASEHWMYTRRRKHLSEL